MLKTYFFSLLTGLCLLLGPAAQAQTPVGDPETLTRPEETPWSHVADSMLQYVDKSQIPSGILYDRVVPYAALPYFDRFQADTTSAAHLRQAYLELFIAAYNRQAFALTPTQLRENSDALTRQGTVPLAVLDYRLHYLDTMAVYNNQLVLQNGLYHDVAGRSSSPYTERLLTLVAPLAQSVTQQAQFQVAPAFLLGNRGRTVSSLLVDFDNGAAPVACLPGQLVSVSYPTSGNKVLRFTVNFTNGTTAQSRARLAVLPQAPANRSVYRLNDFEARDPFTDYYRTIFRSPRSLYGKGEALVVLNNATSESEGTAYKLRNPVIVMDGFDPNDESILRGNDKSIYSLLENQGILDLLTATQRDLVILNFPKSPRRQVGGAITADNIDGGTDYVERNAYVLETLLNNLKSRAYVDPSTGLRDKFAVLGPSMGGLISRYALAHMEKQQQLLTDVGSPADPWWEHNTAEWISFDTPHMGANIPLGDQYLLDFFRDNQAARDNLEQRLDATAAKQFLVAHYTYTGPNVGGAPGYRDRFMLALRDNGERGSYGYPVHLRRVALADGKLNGQLPPSNDGTPCGKMLDLNAYTRFLPGVGAAFIGFFGFSYKTTSPTNIATSTIRFLPNANDGCLIFYGRTNQTAGLSFGRVGPTAIGFKSVQSGSQGSWDLAPGGIRTTQQQLHDQFEAAGQGENFKVNVTDVHPNHCFIPTVSALGFQYQSTASYQNTSSLPNPYTNLYTRNLVCDNETPFDDFYAPVMANSGHVTVPDAAAQAFLIRELTPRVATPIFTSAATGICPGGAPSATFILKRECLRTDANGQTVLPIVYDWTITGSAVFASSGTQTVIGQPIGGTGPSQSIISTATAGTVYLTVVARRSGSLPSIPLTRTLEITRGELGIYGVADMRASTPQREPAPAQPAGGPAAKGTSPAPTSDFACPGTTVNLTAVGLNVPLPYSGTKTTYRNGNVLTRTTFTVFSEAFSIILHEDPIELVLTGTSYCDGQPVISAVYAFDGVTCASIAAQVAVYPNPADQYVEVSTRPGKGTPPAPAPGQANPHAFQATLYNDRGQPVGAATTQQGLVRLPTAALPGGLYHLNVQQGQQTKRFNLSLQH